MHGPPVSISHLHPSISILPSPIFILPSPIFILPSPISHLHPPIPHLPALPQGLVTFLAFYAHAVTVIGNRTPVWRPGPLAHFLLLTKPLEILWRFLTAPLRCTPDVMIIGEVRCGTTTLCGNFDIILGSVSHVSFDFHGFCTPRAV